MERRPSSPISPEQLKEALALNRENRKQFQKDLNSQSTDAEKLTFAGERILGIVDEPVTPEVIYDQLGNTELVRGVIWHLISKKQLRRNPKGEVEPIIDLPQQK